ncbi:MAG: ABC transporter permease [Burkholderiales bacterium]|nr:ABC transporter permease [Burkholderiales bacterium]
MGTAISWRRRIRATAFFVLLMASWHLVVMTLDVPALIFPGPLDVVRALWVGLAGGEMFPHLGVTLLEVIVGFLCGSACGIALGALLAQVRFLDELLSPYVVAFQTLPKVALAPLFAVWFGFGVSSKIVVTATIVFFPVMVNTMAGLRSAPQDQLDLMRAFMASRWQVFRMVRFPQALPYVAAGLDIGIVLAVIGALVGEFVGAQAGLGYLIMQRNASLDIPGVFAILIVLCAMGVVLHAAMKLLARRLVFWAAPASDLGV